MFGVICDWERGYDYLLHLFILVESTTIPLIN